jgi:hypothetical protein
MERAEGSRIHAACFHFRECRGRAQRRAHVLLNAKLCHAADFFRNDVLMVWPSFAGRAHRVLDGGASSATFEQIKAITRFIQRFGTRVN